MTMLPGERRPLYGASLAFWQRHSGDLEEEWLCVKGTIDAQPVLVLAERA